MKEAYNDLDFWKAYSRFFFAAKPAVGGASSLAHSLSNHLPGLPSEKLNVLCLGIGVAGFEYPLLSAIERESGRSLKVMGLDSAVKPLHVSARLCENLQRDFKSSEDFADFINESWPQQRLEELPKLPYGFLPVDLDGRRYRTSIDASKPWLEDFPSCWHQDMRQARLVPNNGFDIISAAFCFHHMHWWRPALCNALSLLRPNGLLLLSQVDGDVSYFDWNQPEKWLVDRRKGEPGMVKRMMDCFWQHPALAEHQLRRPPVGAIRPWAQTDLLERLPLKALNTGDCVSYLAENTMRPSDILAIMTTRGLSPFRRAKEHLGDAYDSHLLSIKEQFCGGNPSDDEPEPTINRISWHAFQSPGSEILECSHVMQKFSDAKSKSKEDMEEPAGIREFELLEASVVAHDSFQAKTLDGKSFENFLEQLILSGTLHNQMPFGVMGRSLINKDRFSSGYYFINPLCQADSAPELMLYMCLRQVHLKDFSNSNILLNEILPTFNLPVVFSYVREDGKASLDLEVQRYRSFNEMRFKIKLPKNYQSTIYDSEAFQRTKKIIEGLLRNQTLSRGRDADVLGNRSSSFILPIGKVHEGQICQFTDDIKAISDKFFGEFSLSAAANALERSLNSCDCLKSLHYRKLFDEKTIIGMSETLYWLSLIPNWRECVIFPAAYANPKGVGVRADDSLILFYTDKLSDSDFRHEYRKVSLMLDQLTMRRLATSGEFLGSSTAISASTHEMKHVALALNRWVAETGQMFEIQESPRNELRIDADKIGTITLAKDSGLDTADLSVIFFPELFRQGTSFIVNWLMSDTPVDLPFYCESDDDSCQMPSSVNELAALCWQAAFDSLIFSKAWQKKWNLKTTLAVKSARGRLRQLFLATPVEVRDPFLLSLVWSFNDDPVRTRLSIWLARLLIHMCREAIQHGDWSQAMLIELSGSNTGKWNICSRNRAGDPKAKKSLIDTLLSDLVELDPFILAVGDGLYCPDGRDTLPNSRTIKGVDVLKMISEKIDENPDISRSTHDEDPYWVKIQFSGKAPLKS